MKGHFPYSNIFPWTSSLLHYHPFSDPQTRKDFSLPLNSHLILLSMPRMFLIWMPLFGWAGLSKQKWKMDSKRTSGLRQLRTIWQAWGLKVKCSDLWIRSSLWQHTRAKWCLSELALRDQVFPDMCQLRKKQLSVMCCTIPQQVGFMQEQGCVQPISYD